MRLPVRQVCKGQSGPAKLLIQPDAEVMQGNLRGQARLQPTELMGAFPIQAEGILELVMDRRHNLADTREPVSPRLGPRPFHFHDVFLEGVYLSVSKRASSQALSKPNRPAMPTLPRSSRRSAIGSSV